MGFFVGLEHQSVWKIENSIYLSIILTFYVSSKSELRVFLPEITYYICLLPYIYI